MWEQKDYTFQGKHFQLDTPHDTCPSRTARAIPPYGVRWAARARARGGRARIGALGFTFSSIKDMGPLLDSYKQAVADVSTPSVNSRTTTP